jgi:hypothetical protein
MIYCFFYRRFPSVHVFFVDHRNDIVVNVFGLIMSIVGDRFVWYLDPIGAMCIALLILFSWASNAFEQVWLLVGKSAPREFISKLIYMTMTHDQRIVKVDTVSELALGCIVAKQQLNLTGCSSAERITLASDTTSKLTSSWARNYR